MVFREATVTDIHALSEVRLAVRENQLSDPNRITAADYEQYLTAPGKGWLCEADGRVAGFAITDIREENVWALFVQPEYEGRGIGKALHHMMLDWYFKQGKDGIWLSTDQGTRAEQFYRKMGWQQCGMHGTELRFTLFAEQWNNLILQSVR